MAELFTNNGVPFVSPFYGIILHFTTEGSVTTTEIAKVMKVWQDEVTAVNSDSAVAAAAAIRNEPKPDCTNWFLIAAFPDSCSVAQFDPVCRSIIDACKSEKLGWLDGNISTIHSNSEEKNIRYWQEDFENFVDGIPAEHQVGNMMAVVEMIELCFDIV